eukprot:4485956-Prymnesium_polylepis.1
MAAPGVGLSAVTVGDKCGRYADAGGYECSGANWAPGRSVGYGANSLAASPSYLQATFAQERLVSMKAARKLQCKASPTLVAMRPPPPLPRVTSTPTHVESNPSPFCCSTAVSNDAALSPSVQRNKQHDCSGQEF